MSRAVSSAVVSQGNQTAIREAASARRFESSKRGPKAESSNKRLPAAPQVRSSRRIAASSPGRLQFDRSAIVSPAAEHSAKPALFRPLDSGNRAARSRPSGKIVAVAPRTSSPVALRRSSTLHFDSARAICGRAGDHPDVYQLLLAVFQGPSREEFCASQDDPTYEPANRLLVRQGARLVAHLQIVPRLLSFGPLQLPMDRMTWLATLPEFRSQGFAGMLLDAAACRALRANSTRGAEVRQSQNLDMLNGEPSSSAAVRTGLPRAAADRAVWGILRTRIPRFFHRWGWAVCGRHSRSRAKTRTILARYWAQPQLRSAPLNIRLWRHVELSALMRIYAQNTAGTFGPLVRSEAYWRWLISRKAFDHIVVAIAGPDKLELDEASAPIVGYAVVRQQRVVELLTDPAYPQAGPQLLARVCADAIERDQQEIELDAPPQDQLHRLVAAADGEFLHHEVEEQEVYMVRRPEMPALVRTLAPLWEARLRDSGMSRACELGLLAGDEKHLLSVGRRGARAIPGRLSRNYIACSSSELTRLVLGHLNPVEAAESGRLTASTQLALEFANLLFPRVQSWHPAWDDLAC